jgi:acetolactate synthase-1/2/3 large subunit
MAYARKQGVIKPQSVVEALHEVTQGRAIVTSDVGQHQMWAAQYYPFDEPRRWINSGGLGTMGFGLPAAMGAKFARPDLDVACITGEGSIQMMTQELSTMLQYSTPVKVVNLNNGYLGMVRQWQEFFYDKRYSMSYMEALPDFVKLAESYGHIGIKVEQESDLKPALIEAFKQKDRTVFLDIITDPLENVFPMIPSGAGHHEMLLAGRDKMASTNDSGLNLV